MQLQALDEEPFEDVACEAGIDPTTPGVEGRTPAMTPHTDPCHSGLCFKTIWNIQAWWIPRIVPPFYRASDKIPLLPL
jgi:hypothetical protein